MCLTHTLKSDLTSPQPFFSVAGARWTGSEPITAIIITPPIYPCSDCRLMVSSHQDWEDHLPDCLRQREKMRKLGMPP
jgi:hypothetical protein